MSNARLKQLMKDNIIKPLKLPPTPKPTHLSNEEGPPLPKQILNELKVGDDIVKTFVFPYRPRNRKKQYRVNLKQCDDFNICIIYVKSMYITQLNFFNQKHSNLELKKRALDCPDDIGFERLVHNEDNSERSSWKFCNSTTLTGSEVVFFSKLRSSDNHH